MSAIPRTMQLRPIDDAARDGRNRLVLGARDGRAVQFALVRWQEVDGVPAWRFGSGRPLPFEPRSYCP